jgi:hypothetical protein
VIEREGGESALGKGAAPGSGCLFFHTRQGVRLGSRRVTLGEVEVPNQAIALAVKLIALHQIDSTGASANN